MSTAVTSILSVIVHIVQQSLKFSTTWDMPSRRTNTLNTAGRRGAIATAVHHSASIVVVTIFSKILPIVGNFVVDGITAGIVSGSEVLFSPALGAKLNNLVPVSVIVLYTV